MWVRETHIATTISESCVLRAILRAKTVEMFLIFNDDQKLSAQDYHFRRSGLDWFYEVQSPITFSKWTCSKHEK